MTVTSILKGQAPPASPARLLLRLDTHEVSPTRPAGVWISEAELEALKDMCFARGKREGEEVGRRQAQQAAQVEAQRDARQWLDQELRQHEERHASEQSEKWRKLASAMSGQSTVLRAELEAEVTEWTFAALTRLLGESSLELVTCAVRNVLNESGLGGGLTVLLHPQDLKSLQDSGAADAANWPEGISFAADPRVSLSGCMVRSAAQTLDARLEVQLALVRKALDELRRERAQRGE